MLNSAFTWPSPPARRDVENVIVSLSQRVESILGLLYSASMSLRIEFARFRRFAARSVCPPFGKNDRLIRLREHEGRLCATRLSSALEYDPCRTDISTSEQRAGARHQSGCFRITLRLCGRWLCWSDCLYSLSRLGDQAIRSRLKCSARINRALPHCQFARQWLGLVALLLQLRRRSFRNLLELRRIIARLGQLRRVRLDLAARHRELAGQSLGTFALFLLLRRHPFYSLPELRRIVARLGQLCRVCLDLAARHRELARQRLCTFALFLLLRPRPFRGLPQLR